MKHEPENENEIEAAEPFDMDWLFEKRTGKIDNAFEDVAYGISPDLQRAMRRDYCEEFENLVDSSF